MGRVHLSVQICPGCCPELFPSILWKHTISTSLSAQWGSFQQARWWIWVWQWFVNFRKLQKYGQHRHSLSERISLNLFRLSKDFWGSIPNIGLEDLVRLTQSCSHWCFDCTLMNPPDNMVTSHNYSLFYMWHTDVYAYAYVCVSHLCYAQWNDRHLLGGNLTKDKVFHHKSTILGWIFYRDSLQTLSCRSCRRKWFLS